MQPVADIGDGPPGHGSLQTLGRMFAVFRAITTQLRACHLKMAGDRKIDHAELVRRSIDDRLPNLN